MAIVQLGNIMDAPSVKSVTQQVREYPRQIRVENCSFCSSACSFCHAHGGNNPLSPTAKLTTPRTQFMPWKLYEKLILEIATWPVFLEELVPQNFGEWFLSPNWYDQGLLAERFLPSAKLTVVTTGYSMTPATVDKLCSLGNWKYINFSVNAFFKETYERIHHRSARAVPKVREAIERIKQQRPDVEQHVSMVYDSQFVSELERDLFQSYWAPIVPVSISYASYANNPLRKPQWPVDLPCRSIFDGLTVFTTGDVATTCCLIPTQDILTDIGPQPIKDVTVGTQVLTSRGRWRPVTNILRHGHAGHLVQIKPAHMAPFLVTPSHPVLTDSGWVLAGKLTREHSLITPVPESTTGTILDLAEYAPPIQTKVRRDRAGHQRVITRPVRVEGATIRRSRGNPLPRFLALGNETLTMLGLFVAEGYTTGKGIMGRRAGWAFGKHEADKAERVQLWLANALGVSSALVERRTTLTVHANSSLLGSLLESWFGHMAWGKRLPSWVLGLDNKRLGIFLMGYLIGDGYFTKDGSWRGATVSHTLATQLQLVAATLGSYCHVHEKDNATKMIEGRSIKTHKVYTWGFPKALNLLHAERPAHQLVAIEGLLWVPYTGGVLNLEIAEDETYLAGLTTVHNCFAGDPVADHEMVIGHYPEEKLLDIWKGARLRRLMELHNSGRRGEIEICRNCTFA